MRSVKFAIVILLALAVRVAPAWSQECIGLPSFAGASVHVNFAAQFPDSATLFAAGIGAGRERSLFANIGAGQVTYEGLEEKATFGFLELGYQVPLGRMQLCPLAGLFGGTGPDDDLAALDVSSYGVSGGLAVGTPFRLRALALIPNATLRYDYSHVMATDAAGGVSSQSFDALSADLGLGLVFRDRFTVQPLVHIPLTDTDDAVSFGIFAAVRFSWKDW